MNRLDEAVIQFNDIVHLGGMPDHSRFYYVISKLHDLCFAISESERNGIDRESIHEKLLCPRSIHSRSPFINRLQTWPRGYQGDFETIEYLCENTNRSPRESTEYYLEWYALNSAIAQQHRNKIAVQSKYIHDTAVGGTGKKILVIGCGSGRDIRGLEETIVRQDVRLYLNDMDPAAIAYTKMRLDPRILGNVVFIEDNVLRLIRNPEFMHLGFDLVLFGGMFDYLSGKLIRTLLKKMYGMMLEEGGKIIFGNIGSHNPFRVWLEYLVNWKLIERNADDCLGICIEAGIPAGNVRIFEDNTKLTLITEIVKSAV
jgi:extracellular factor (EF) 3-hydroxypalmitic acid methyl ester biosynthesis protein